MNQQKTMADLARQRARQPIPTPQAAAAAPRHDGGTNTMPAHQDRGPAPATHPAMQIPTPPGGSSYGAHHPHPSGNDAHQASLGRQAATVPTATDPRTGQSYPDPAGAQRRAADKAGTRMGNLVFHGDTDNDGY